MRPMLGTCHYRIARPKAAPCPPPQWCQHCGGSVGCECSKRINPIGAEPAKPMDLMALGAEGKYEDRTLLNGKYEVKTDKAHIGGDTLGNKRCTSCGREVTGKGSMNRRRRYSSARCARCVEAHQTAEPTVGPVGATSEACEI